MSNMSQESKQFKFYRSNGRDMVRIVVKDPENGREYKAGVEKSFIDAPHEEQDYFIRSVLLPYKRKEYEKKLNPSYLKGLAANAARGLSLGASDFIPGLSYAADDFAIKNPKTAIAADLLGSIAPILVTGGAGAAIKGGALAAKAGGSLAAKNILKKAASLTPVHVLDEAVTKVAPNSALLRSVLGGAAGAGFYNANVKNDKKGAYADNFIEGAAAGAILSPIVHSVVSAVPIVAKEAISPIANNFMKKSRKEDALKYVEKKLGDAGISLEDLIPKLKEAPSNSRLYDVDPHLGIHGVMSRLSSDSRNYNTIRKKASEDLDLIENILEGKGGILEKHFGRNVPEGYRDTITEATKTSRREKSSPKYKQFKELDINLYEYPDLLQKLSIVERPEKVLVRNFGKSDDLDFKFRLDDFYKKLQDANKEVNKLKDHIEGMRATGASKRDIDKYVSNKLQDSGLNLTVRGDVLDAIEKANSYSVSSIADQYKKFGSTYDVVDSNKQALKRALTENIPSYRQAQETYAKKSKPLNLIDLIDNVFNSKITTTDYKNKVSDLVDFTNKNEKTLAHRITRNKINELLHKSGGAFDASSRVSKLLNDVSSYKPILDRLASTSSLESDAFTRDLLNQDRIAKSRKYLLRESHLPNTTQNLSGDIAKILTTPILSTEKKTISIFEKVKHWIETKGINKEIIDILNARPEEALKIIDNVVRNRSALKGMTSEKILRTLSTNIVNQYLTEGMKYLGRP